MNREKKQQLLEQYPAGTRVEMIHMPADPHPIPQGTRGTVTGIDDLPSLLVKWDNHRSLSLLPDVDQFKVVTDDK